MNVLALNSSPRAGGHSKTEWMLEHLVHGMRDAGADVEVINLHGKKIEPCIGCYTCWTKTPGKCLYKDDMTAELFPQWKASDMVVYATPLYNYTLNATLKAFLERTLPALEPFFEIHDGRMAHPLRHKVPAVVALSVAGMPDDGHFEAMSNFFRYYMASPGRKLLAEIYRPTAEMLAHPIVAEISEDIQHATVQAGRELVTAQRIEADTMARIRQPVMAPETFMSMANPFWKSCIAKGMTPKEFTAKEHVPRPDSLESFMAMFPAGIEKSAAANGEVCLQFDFSGDVHEPCHFVVNADRVEAVKGAHSAPDLVIRTPFALWMDIMIGEADGQTLFMEQKYTVEGEFAMMLKLFGKGES